MYQYVLVSQHGNRYLFFCCLSKKSLHPLPPEGHPAAARSMKLLAKIPKDAEAVIVLVGKLLILFKTFRLFLFDVTPNANGTYLCVFLV